MCSSYVKGKDSKHLQSNLKRSKPGFGIVTSTKIIFQRRSYFKVMLIDLLKSTQ